MKQSCLYALLSIAVLLPSSTTHAIDRPPPRLCGPTTPGTCEVKTSPVITPKAEDDDECGFAKCGGGTLVLYPTLECEYISGVVACSAWPEAWPNTDEPITYLWSATGSLSLPPGYGDHASSVSFECNSTRGGTVLLSMQAPGGSNWAELSASVACRTGIPQ
jgi:hypothetical protein